MKENLTERKLKILAFLMETENAKKEKCFDFLNGHFTQIDGPMDIILSVFSETNVRLLKSIFSYVFLKYSESYNNLNVKSILKLNDL